MIMRVAAIVKPCPSPYCVSINPLKLNATEFSWTPLKHSANLAKKWMEYQGINNWQGLLDPLDDILRSEIGGSGCFDFDPSPPTYATSKLSKNSILTRSCIGDTGQGRDGKAIATCLEWLDNLRATLTCLSNDVAKVESGFLSLYTSAVLACSTW
ncbi:hypothetical protein V6N13_003171 [Hibiscus sabdariffa]